METEQHILSGDDLGWLLNHLELSTSPQSLLHGLTKPRSVKGIRARLKKEGLLDKIWGDAIARLARSDASIVMQNVALDWVDTGCYCGNTEAAEDGLLAWRAADGNFVLSLPQDLAGLLNQAEFILDPAASGPPQLFEASFTPAGLTAFAATIDLLRMLLAASILERQGLPGVIMRTDDLESQVAAGIRHRDNRSLVALLNALMPDAFPAAQSEFADGLSELAAAGLIAQLDKEKGEWSPRADMLGFALDLISPVPALSVAPGLIGAAENGHDTPRLIALRGNSLWHFEPVWNDKGSLDTIRLRCLDGLTSLIEIRQAFENAMQMSAEAKLAAKKSQRKARGKPAAKKRAAKSKSVGTDTGKKVRNDAAEPVKPAAAARVPKFCGQCGSKLIAGKKFCSSCGEAIAQS